MTHAAPAARATTDRAETLLVGPSGDAAADADHPGQANSSEHHERPVEADHDGDVEDL